MKTKTASSAAPLPGALNKEEIDGKAALIAKENAAARADLETHFGAKRWGVLRNQSIGKGVPDEQLTALCGKMRRTRNEWHPANAPAALHSAAIGLLIALGSSPSDADVAAYEATLKDSSTPAQ